MLPSVHPSPQPKQKIDQFSHFCTAHRRMSLGRLAPPGCCHCTRAYYCPLESKTQTANGLVQPFLHSSWQKVPILYNWRHYPPKLPLPIGNLDQHLTHDFWAHMSPQLKRHLDRYSHFCTAHSRKSLYNGCPYPPKLPLSMTSELH